MTIHYLNRSQLDNIPDLEPMIDGVLDKGTVAMLVAQPAAGKSFLAMDWVCHYATEAEAWQGRAISRTVTYPDDKPVDEGKVLYIAAEGVKGMKYRLRAWEQTWRRTVAPDRLTVVPHPIQLGNTNAVAELCHDLQQETCGLVVIDTLARCAMGLEENSSTDMGRVVHAAYQIRDAMGPDGTVLLIHHLSKAGTIRGSSALLGGVDQVMILTRSGDALKLEDEKRKDGAELEPMNLRLKPVHGSLIVEAGRDDDPGHNPLVQEMAQLNHLLPLSKNELRMATSLPESAFFHALNRGLKSGQIVSTQDKTPKYRLSTQGNV